ncbi:MAG: nuclear transport factor 2 family protein, partial [Acidobacteriota bacterium]|nr:nuclear transport factor 2 family protein [Acidobacteriota bacterium]
PLFSEIAGQSRPRIVSNDSTTQAELNSSLDKWISATNARNVDQQMKYYAPKVDAYYQSRNASQDAVRSDKKRAFERATSVDIKTGKPEIIVSPDGRSAKMRFRKKYVIKEGQPTRNGEVIQELHWVKSGNGWRIVSERDVQVVKN